MPAYVIFIREKTRDADQLDRYKEKAQPVFANHPVTFRAYNGRHEILEGPNAEGVLILEFPSFDAARAWYHDPDAPVRGFGLSVHPGRRHVITWPGLRSLRLTFGWR